MPECLKCATMKSKDGSSYVFCSECNETKDKRKTSIYTAEQRGVTSEAAPIEEEQYDDDDDDETITYDGVEYVIERETNEVYTMDEMELIGTWNGSSIDWEDEDSWKLHEEQKM
jgi:hypothetical protein